MQHIITATEVQRTLIMIRLKLNNAFDYEGGRGRERDKRLESDKRIETQKRQRLHVHVLESMNSDIYKPKKHHIVHGVGC